MANPQPSESTPSARLIRAVFAWVGQRRGKIVWLAVLAALVMSSLNAFYQVRVGESAVKRRFGRLVSVGIEPGLHWHFPFGVEQVDIRPTEEIRRLEIEGQISPELAMLTGDINFANCTMAVQYRISDLNRFLFGHEDPEGVLKDVVRGHVIDTINSMFIDMVLATEKRHVEEQVQKECEETLNSINLGIEVTSVSLSSVEPPVEAMAAFRAVNDARLNKQTVINATHKRVESLLARARGDAERILEDAKAKAKTRVAQSTAAGRRFTALLAEHEAQPRQTRMTEYWDTVRKVFDRAKIVLLNPNEKPTVAVNLIESPDPFPLGVAGVNSSGAKLPQSAHADVNQTESDRHPTTSKVHARVFGKNQDRKPGMGAHLDSKEAHPYPVPMIGGTNLPPHRLGTTEGKGGRSKEDGQLDQPRQAAKDKK